MDLLLLLGGDRPHTHTAVQAYTDLEIEVKKWRNRKVAIIGGGSSYTRNYRGLLTTKMKFSGRDCLV